MTDIWKAIILGIIEGITEFLPISSTGHLILANQYVSFSEPFTRKFDVIIQLGAILAVVVLYWRRLVPGRKNSWGRSLALWSKALVAVIPALILGALFHEQIETLLFNPTTVSLTLAFWGIILIAVAYLHITVRTESVQQLSYQTVLLIGLMQCLAMVPGTSRSAVTIVGAMLLGSSRLAAVEFSFFLAIPTMIAASAFSVFQMGFGISSSELFILATGFLTSFVVALIVIRFFINFITTRDFRPFGYYRIVLGSAVFAYFLFKT